MTPTTPLISELSMVKVLQPARGPPGWMLPTSPEMVPYKGRGVVPVCANKVSNGPASADQGFSTASQGGCHVHEAFPVLKQTHLPLSHLFC